MKKIGMLGGTTLMVVSLQALAHGGGLDASGCHHNRKTGEYHCHRASTVPLQPTPSQAPAYMADDLQRPQPSKLPGAPVCHVGPRGGTYTITSSGRKNYGGC